MELQVVKTEPLRRLSPTPIALTGRRSRARLPKTTRLGVFAPPRPVSAALHSAAQLAGALKLALAMVGESVSSRT
eukprot:scaffold4851_cov428-Prasinococcus_capsulatus_cf.AAC.9